MRAQSADAQHGPAGAAAPVPDFASCETDRILYPPDVRGTMSGADVEELQDRLKELGDYSGAANGQYDVGAVRAVEKVQRAYGMEPTGVCDESLWEALGSEADSAASRWTVPKAAPPGTVRLVIDATRATLTVLSDDHIYATFAVAVGKRSTPSPRGEFRIMSKGAHWGGAFGTRWMRVSCPWGVFGIHGTNKPWSVGRSASHGCFRMLNSDIERLYKWVPVGTPVDVGPLGEALPTSLAALTKGSVGPTVVSLQLALRRVGFSSGRADGSLGPATMASVSRLHRAYGLPAPTAPTSDTLCLLRLIDAAAALPTGAITNWVLGRSDTFRPNTTAKPHPDKVYSIRLWVGIPPGAATSHAALRSWTRVACATASTAFAPCRVAVKEFPAADLRARVRSAVKAGDPPDIVVFPPGTLGYFGTLQVPLDGYLTKAERGNLKPAAVSGAGASDSRGRARLVAWPFALRAGLWLANTKVLASQGLSADTWLSGGISRSALAKALPSGMGVAVALGDAFTEEPATPEPGPGEGQSKRTSPAAIPTPLSDVLGGKAACLAPISARLALLLARTGLGGAAASSPEGTGPATSLELMPVPPANAGVSGPWSIKAQVGGVALFRGTRRHFHGNDQLRVAAEIARTLAQSSDELCKACMWLPADAKAPPPVLSGFSAVLQRLVCSPAARL